MFWVVVIIGVLFVLDENLLWLFVDKCVEVVIELSSLLYFGD